jgi:aconitate hydratase 2/2-methylisocitrate dehydratase
LRDRPWQFFAILHGNAFGVMPLDMPESVLVKFIGELQPGVTLRDIVNAIPWVAMQLWR